MAKHIFIDTNIFLNFYRYSSDDLEELKKISHLIREGEIILYVTQQIVDEFMRNRDSAVTESYKKFDEIKVDQSFPYICKTYDEEYKNLRDSIKLFSEAKNTLADKLVRDIENNSLKADDVVKNIFTTGEVIEVTTDLLDKAVNRYKLGNPPGKNDSYGDAINWEILLEKVPNSKSIYFVTDDKDFKSQFDQSKFNSFLLDEWKRRKESEVIFYNQLSTFFKDNYPEIKLREEEAKNKLIDLLSQSGNFSETHAVISGLSKYAEFTPNQIRQLVEISVSNNQVYWISEDEDVYSFFRGLVKGKIGLIDQDTLEEFMQYFKDKEQEEFKSDVLSKVNDIPF